MTGLWMLAIIWICSSVVSSIIKDWFVMVIPALLTVLYGCYRLILAGH